MLYIFIEKKLILLMICTYWKQNMSQNIHMKLLCRRNMHYDCWISCYVTSVMLWYSLIDNFGYTLIPGIFYSCHINLASILIIIQYIPFMPIEECTQFIKCHLKILNFNNSYHWYFCIIFSFICENTCHSRLNQPQPNLCVECISMITNSFLRCLGYEIYKMI